MKDVLTNMKSVMVFDPKDPKEETYRKWKKWINDNQESAATDTFASGLVVTRKMLNSK